MGCLDQMIRFKSIAFVSKSRLYQLQSRIKLRKQYNGIEAVFTHQTHSVASDRAN